MTPGLQKLTEILEVAQREGADAVQLERNRGELEVMYIEGSSGIGYAIRDRRIQDEIMSFIFDKANLNKRVRGKFTMTINGADVTVEAREYQSFDETCVELRLSKRNTKRKKKAD